MSVTDRQPDLHDDIKEGDEVTVLNRTAWLIMENSTRLLLFRKIRCYYSGQGLVKAMRKLNGFNWFGKEENGRDSYWENKKQCWKTVKPGDIVTVNVDRVMIHDIFIPFVAEKFEEMGFTKLWDPDKAVLIYDHLVPASQLDDTRHFHAGDAFSARKYGMKKCSQKWWNLPPVNDRCELCKTG